MLAVSFANEGVFLLESGFMSILLLVKIKRNRYCNIYETSIPFLYALAAFKAEETIFRIWKWLLHENSTEYCFLVRQILFS